MSSRKALDLIGRFLEESVDVIKGIDVEQLYAIAMMIVRCYKNGGKVMICGNGGSAAQAQHLAAELVCKYKLDRIPLSAMALTTDTSILTAQANDVSYETIFERQVDAHGKKGDVLLALSTSGNSPNIVRALDAANGKSICTIAFTGKNQGCSVAEIADIVLFVDSVDTPRIQEAHIVAGHIVCDLVEREFAVKGKKHLRSAGSRAESLVSANRNETASH